MLLDQPARELRAFTWRDEFCYIFHGHVRLIGNDGTVQSLKTGDAFLIVNGFNDCWGVVETTPQHLVARHRPTR